MSKPKITIGITAIVVTGALVVGGIFARQLWNLTSDIVNNISYTPSSEVGEIIDKIELTDQGKFIFGGARPEIEERDEFNENCDSHDEEVSTLGCYGNRKIHIYNVVAEELKGIKESTAAHELMHAVWAHLSESERNGLKDSIMEVYNDEKYHDDFADELKTYSDDDFIEELHSRLATEVRDLPNKLEEHYSKYFKNQDKLVDFYDNYRGPFKELEAKIKNMESDLKNKKAKIESLESEYTSRSEAFGKAVDEFNSCAEKTGCFASESAFRSRREQLVREQAALDTMYDSLTKSVDEYNTGIEDYNNNVLRSRKLDNMMNSNSKVDKI